MCLDLLIIKSVYKIRNNREKGKGTRKKRERERKGKKRKRIELQRGAAKRRDGVKSPFRLFLNSACLISITSMNKCDICN